MPQKYALPVFLSGVVAQGIYERWLRRKAQAHVRRDRRRGNQAAMGESYRDAIHTAVIKSNGKDAYTGEILDWTLIGQYDNDESRERGRHYKREFALLPTVDHVGDGTGCAIFIICGWRTNDAKNDLDLSEFVSLCRAVLEQHGYVVKQLV
jgi:hypothetical protein